MGAGIAHAFPVAGAGSPSSRATTDAAEAARQRIDASLAKALAKGAEVKGELRGRHRSRCPGRMPTSSWRQCRSWSDLKREVLERDRRGRPGRRHRQQHQLAVDRPARQHAARPVPADRAALLQPGPGQRPGRDRRRRADGTGSGHAMRRPGSPRSARPPSPCRTRRASRAAGSASRSRSRRCGCSRRAWPAPPTSTPR